jgi:PPE-repeat protein
MPDPRWTGPPELVAAIFEAGSAASVLANNLVWVTETANKELAEGLSAVNAITTAAQWQGLGAVGSMVAATGLNAGLQTLVGWTAHKISITQAAVEAFVIAQSSVIPSVVSQTNRDETGVLHATNWFGQNSPAIAEREGEYYGVHWPHNSRIGWTYSGTTRALVVALGIPPPAAPMGASPAAPAAAGEAVGQAAAQTGMNNAMQVSGQVSQAAGQTAATRADAGGQLSSLMQQPMSMVSSASEPLKGMLQAPMQAFQGVGSLPQTMLQSLAGMFPAAGASNAGPAAAVAGPVLAGSGLGGASAGASAGGSVGGAGGLGAFPGAGLTSYTRPTSSFEPETGGRPVGLRAGVLNAAEVRSPAASGMGGAPMPLTPAGMLARGSGGESDKDVVRARVVVDGRPTGPR